MKIALATILLSAATGALAQGAPFEIRFHPGERIYAYPLDEQGRYRSVQLQNAVVINRTGEPIALASIDLELVAPPSAVETRQFDGDELERAAKAGYMLHSSGLMEALRFQFGGEALVPAGVTFAQGTVLQPNEAILLARQTFAMRGAQTQFRVKVRGLSDGRVVEASRSIPIVSTESKTAYRFPLAGTWYVGAGPTLHSHHRTVVAQEFAFDLVRLNGDGRTFRDNGERRSDYLAHGSKVFAAADGKVVSVVDSEPETDEDLRRPGEALDAYMMRVKKAQMGRIGRGTNAVIGNHVVIEHSSGEYSVYAHLKPGSIRVKEGDRVRTGDAIAQVGTSGNSTEPHLHFQVCDSGEPLLCAGIPVRFTAIEITNADSERPLQTGDLVVAR
jgi:murein DD-endopeptidase MepM/ murein hydrolase activator NlpD